VTEDEVKAAFKRYLEAQGYDVRVAWGRRRGIDIEATGPAGHFLIEAKGEVANQPQKTNYFLGGCRRGFDRTIAPTVGDTSRQCA
jgi:hypothetical protein